MANKDEITVRGYEDMPAFGERAKALMPEVRIRESVEIPDYSEYGYGSSMPYTYAEPEAGQKIKRPLQALGYAVRKYITDPVYKGVDVWAQKGGNKLAELLGAHLKDSDKYADVDFGANGGKQGYETLGDYFRAKDKYENDYQNYREALDDPNAWYASANNEDYVGLNEPSDADSRWASLTGTKAYEDWQPDTMVGKVVKGASGIAGDMLPSNLEGYAIENAPKMLGTLSPAFIKAKQKLKKYRDSDMFGGDVDKLRKDYAGAYTEAVSHPRNNQEIVRKAMEEGKQGYRGESGKRYYEGMERLKKELTPQQYQDLVQGRYGASADITAAMIPEESEMLKAIRADREAANTYKYAIDNGLTPEEAFQGIASTETSGNYYRNPPKRIYPSTPEETQIAKSIERNYYKQPKPLPNPAAQRAEAITKMGYNPTQYPELKEIEHLYPEYVALGRKGVENLDEFEKARFVEIAERLANLGFFSE